MIGYPIARERGLRTESCQFLESEMEDKMLTDQKNGLCRETVRGEK